MNKLTIGLMFSALSTALIIPAEPFAKTTATNLVLLNASTGSCVLQGVECTYPGVAAANHTIEIAVYAQSDGNDNPWIVQTAGPHLVLQQAFAAGRSPDARGSTFGYQNAIYEWTPTVADIGLNASASFRLTSASGKTLNVNVPIGMVQSLPDVRLVTDVTVMPVGDQLNISWTPPTDGSAPYYKLFGCMPPDPSIGTPVCKEYPMPDVKSLTNPGGIGNQAMIPAIAAVGSFGAPVRNFMLNSAPYPSVSTPLAALYLMAGLSTNMSGWQDYVVKLPQ